MMDIRDCKRTQMLPSYLVLARRSWLLWFSIAWLLQIKFPLQRDGPADGIKHKPSVLTSPLDWRWFCSVAQPVGRLGRRTETLLHWAGTKSRCLPSKWTVRKESCSESGQPESTSPYSCGWQQSAINFTDWVKEPEEEMLFRIICAEEMHIKQFKRV